MDRSEVRVQEKFRDFLFSKTAHTKAHPASYSLGTGVLSWGVKRSGRGVDHLPSTTAVVKNQWSYTFPPPCIHSWSGHNKFTCTTENFNIMNVYCSCTNSYRRLSTPVLDGSRRLSTQPHAKRFWDFQRARELNFGGQTKRDTRHTAL
jgi:hypothetical protein